jgi:hypothetical protein
MYELVVLRNLQSHNSEIWKRCFLSGKTSIIIPLSASTQRADSSILNESRWWWNINYCVRRDISKDLSFWGAGRANLWRLSRPIFPLAVCHYFQLSSGPGFCQTWQSVCNRLSILLKCYIYTWMETFLAWYIWMEADFLSGISKKAWQHHYSLPLSRQ